MRQSKVVQPPSVSPGVSAAKLWTLRLTLIALVVVAFAPALRAGFVNYDDDVSVTANPTVVEGITAHSVRYAFTTLDAGYYIPLTWLSLAADAQVWHKNPFGYHLTNVLLHAASTLLLFEFLRRHGVGSLRSAVVAALFGVHPLHVESVAWISERKDVLSGFFGMLTLIAYGAYTRTPSIGRLALASAAFAASLLAKPMLLMLPVVLLLLDYWPLARTEPAADIRQPLRKQRLLRRLIEKTPFVLLSLGFLIATLVGEKRVGALATSPIFAMPIRLESAVVSYATYVSKTFWPVDLAIFYPHPGYFPATAVAVALTVVFTLSALAVAVRKGAPNVFVGWFWFLILLLPSCGFVQVGAFYIADRYSYFPTIGLFFAIVSLIPQRAGRSSIRSALVPLTLATVIAGLTYLSVLQCIYWHDSISLFQHDIAVVGDNSQAYLQLGSAYEERSDFDAARDSFVRVIELNPLRPQGYARLADVLSRQGDLDRAAVMYRQAIHLFPNYLRARQRLSRIDDQRGVEFLHAGRLREAIAALTEATQADPENLTARDNLALAKSREK